MDYTNSSLNPPLIPGLPGMPMNGNYAPTSSPFFTVANQFLPRNLNDVIRWSRYITMQSPVTTEVLRKFATYPITDFIVDSDSSNVKKTYESLFQKLNLKTVLHDIGFEYYSLGNVFISLYTPIFRELICPTDGCGARYPARNANFVKFTKYNFVGQCPKCNSNVVFMHHDKRSSNLDEMNVIKWDPLNIAVNNNPITGECEYWYKFPNDIKRRVQMGDRLFVDTVPWEFIEAIKNNQDFKFGRDMIYHLRNVSTGQMINGVAVPPLISLFSLVFYQATLRRANEAIATDFMSPMRVIFPQAQTGNSDPAVQMSLRSFVANMQNSIIRHKMDRNHVLVAPVPIGYQTISGEGKTLLVSAEIEQAEESILLSLGVSRELLSGNTNWTSSTVGLRLLQNTMQCYTSQIEGLINWIGRKAAAHTKWDEVEITLAPFTLMDDPNLQNLLMQAAQAQKGSWTTLYESFGMDYADEMENLKREAVDLATSQIESQIEVEQAQFLAAKKTSDKLDQNDDYRTALQQAQQIVENLINADDSMKRNVLNQLKLDDYAMYLMCSKLLQEHSEAKSAELAMQNAAAVGGDPNDPNAQKGPPGSGRDADAAPGADDANTSPDGPNASGGPGQPSGAGPSNQFGV